MVHRVQSPSPIVPPPPCPVLFLDPEKRTYDRYARFARLQFLGATADDAARVAGMSAGAGRSLM